MMYKQKFYSALEKQFVGEEIQGESGFVNLMKIKKEYYDNIKSDIKQMIEATVSDKNEEKEIFEKLYTFFDSYLNETGTPFFNDTQIHKNLYEKVYSDNEDVSLFWKTEDLYYVKTEQNYSNMEIEKEEYKYIFDASEIENKATNNKKNIGFYLIKADKENKILNFKIKYQEQNSYDKLKEILDIKNTNRLKDFLINDFNNSDEYSTIKFNDELKIRNVGNKSVKRKMLDIREKDDTLTDVVTIDFAAEGLDDICEYLINRKDFDVKREHIKKVFATYARQDKIDYFIHKNAEKFLKEQFNQYLFNYVYDNEIVLEDKGIKRAQQLNKLKKIAFNIIKLIAKFENELKNIWEKPKFVRNSNYVLTLDKLKDNISLIKEIINHPSFDKQISEWKKLKKEKYDNNGEKVKKEWQEFNFVEIIEDLNNEERIEEMINNNNLKEKYKKAPIDTKIFNSLKYEILSNFNDLDEITDGYLIKTENWQGINTINNKFKEKIDLIYIDPPFNTGDDFDYIDEFQDSTWLTLMKNRISNSKNMMSNKSSIYLHLDNNANYYGRILLDDLFGKDNFRNEIVWNTASLNVAGFKGDANKWIYARGDILYYVKNKNNFIFNKQYKNIDKKELIEKYNYLEDENGQLYRKTRRDNVVYLDDEKGDPYTNIWNDILSFNYVKIASSESLFFNTQKPEKLLGRIIKASSNKNSFIFDYFLGSGTTIAVAHKYNRKWVGMEMGEQFYKKALPRMKKVLAGDENTTVSKEVNWQGGGFFKYYELESYEDILRKAKYKKNRDESNKYSFMSDEKMLDALELDYDEENIKIKFENLYPDVDIAETLSNLFGKNIKRLNDKRVVFEDGKKIIFDEMTFEKYPRIKELIWWGGVDNG